MKHHIKVLLYKADSVSDSSMVISVHGHGRLVWAAFIVMHGRSAKCY
jgi:hypothetical protein